jgi:hypothetical protein
MFHLFLLRSWALQAVPNLQQNQSLGQTVTKTPETEAAAGTKIQGVQT